MNPNKTSGPDIQARPEFNTPAYWAWLQDKAPNNNLDLAGGTK